MDDIRSRSPTALASIISGSFMNISTPLHDTQATFFYYLAKDIRNLRVVKYVVPC